MYNHHNPEYAQPLMDELLKSLGAGWSDSSYGNDCTSSISFELPSGSLVCINIPNSELDEPMDEEFAEYTVCIDSGDFWNFTHQSEAVAKAREIINRKSI
jgi:hypothetical protein|tara:strand:+ start:506 stop:805 length:300 start_codon:yes stop_codon:yes gene_type:complete